MTSKRGEKEGCDPKPKTLKPKPETETRNPKPETLNPTPYVLNAVTKKRSQKEG